MLNGQAMENSNREEGVDYQIGDAAFTRDQLESWEPQKKGKLTTTTTTKEKWKKMIQWWIKIIVFKLHF